MGVLIAMRNPKGRRYYTIQQVLDFKSKHGGNTMGTTLKVLHGDCKLFDELRKDIKLQQKMKLFYSQESEAFLCDEEVFNKTIESEVIKKVYKKECDDGYVYGYSLTDFLDMMWEDSEYDITYGVGCPRDCYFTVSLCQWGEIATENIKDIGELLIEKDWYVYITLNTRRVLFDTMLDSMRSSMRYYRESIH